MKHIKKFNESNSLDYDNLFKRAIKRAEGLRSIKDIETDDFNTEDDHFYCSFKYDIDDRNDNRGYDEDIKKKIERYLGNEYYVMIDRVDAYPSGYAHYRVTISK